MPRQLGAAADQEGLGAPPDLDGVVGHEPMAAHDEIQGALALADAAVPGDEHAEPEDVHQHRVKGLTLGQVVFEQGAELGDGGRRSHRRLEQRHPQRARLRSRARRPDETRR